MFVKKYYYKNIIKINIYYIYLYKLKITKIIILFIKLIN